MLGNMITLAAAPVAATSKSSSSSFNVILIIIVLFAVVYFVMIRPQRNRQRKVAEQQKQAQPGQRVRTTAGMYATVVAVDGDDVILEVAPGVEVRYVKRAIMQVLPDEEPGQAEPSYEAEDETPGHEAAGHEAAGHEAAGHDTAGHDATGESPNGAPAAADESRTQGTV